MSKAKQPLSPRMQQLADVELSRTQEQLLMQAINDSRKSEEQKFYRARDLIFEALVRQAVGEDEFSRLCLTAKQRATTVMAMVNASKRPKRGG